MVREVDTRRMVDNLRERARSATARWAPGPDEQAAKLQPMRNHPALRYMHEHWAIKSALEPPSLRSVRGRPRESVRAFFRRWLFSAMSRYLDEEQELTANMVRLQDALAKRCDSLSESQAEMLESLRADMIELAARVDAQLERLGTHAKGGSG